jgi:hypothetical protein
MLGIKRFFSASHFVGATTDLPPADLQVNEDVLNQDVEPDTGQIKR